MSSIKRLKTHEQVFTVTVNFRFSKWINWLEKEWLNVAASGFVTEQKKTLDCDAIFKCSMIILLPVYSVPRFGVALALVLFSLVSLLIVSLSAVIWKRSDFYTANAYVNHHLILVRTTQIAFNWGQFISLIFHWFLINLWVD